jgi:hypothetical protein
MEKITIIGEKIMSKETHKLDQDKTNKSDFISIEEYNNFEKSSFNKFVRITPGPQLDGYYRVRFLGKVFNPDHNWKGYLSTSAYFLYQLRCVKNFGKDAAAFLVGGIDFSIAGAIILVLGFILGILIRLPIGILLTIIQSIVVIFASKTNK